MTANWRQRPNPHLKPRADRSEIPASTGFQPGGRNSLTVLPVAPHLPAPYDKADIGAWKALNMGTAAPHQQQRCLDHLAFVTNFNGTAYVDGDPVATAFALGKRAVMVEIFKIINTVMHSRDDGGEQG